MEKVDLAISLIPYTFHATVIKSAIRKKKNVVTTSYVSPAMLELEDKVKEAGITVMNEIGLDPGIVSCSTNECHCESQLTAVRTTSTLSRLSKKSTRPAAKSSPSCRTAAAYQHRKPVTTLLAINSPGLVEVYSWLSATARSSTKMAR